MLKKALRKINGILDRSEKIIYIDADQVANRKRYIKLHEVGHSVLPWQKELYEIIEDDEINIGESAKDEFEMEANCFASATIFQLNSFFEEMIKFPLEIGSAMHLSKYFGASVHATLRRFVECSNKRCALLVLKNLSVKNLNCKKRNYFQSAKFSSTFGLLKWNDELGVEWPFVQDYIQKRRLHKDGFFQYSLNGQGILKFDYHFFNNTYNAFVLILPIGEQNRVRTKLVYKA